MRRGWALDAVAAWSAIVLGLGLILYPMLAPSARPDANAASYATIGGPFRLTDQNGRAVDESVLKGKWSAVFFGFVTCPDICPATLQTLAAAQTQLGKAEDRFQVVFISVDPERDSPELIKTYLEQDSYPPHAVGLTGAPEQLRDVAKAYRAYYALVPRTDGRQGYDVTHTNAIYLVNPKGVTQGVLMQAMGPQGIAEAIKTAMSQRS